MPKRQARPDVGVLGRNPRMPLYRARSSIAAAVFAALALDVLMLAAVCGSAWAATWRLNGPERPAAGENSTYVIRGPAGAEHSGTVRAGARLCRQSGLTDPSETSSWDGYLNDGGVDSRQFSFARGRSTICVYDDVSRSAVARKVVRTIAGRDRLRLSVAPIESHSDGLLVTATGYLGRIGDPTYYSGSAADQHVGTVIVTARARSRPCPRRAPEESAFRTASADIDDARFSAQIAVPDALDRSDRPVVCAYLTAVRHANADVRTRTVARASIRYSADPAGASGDSAPDETGLWLPGLLILPLGIAVWALVGWLLFLAARGLGRVTIGLMAGSDRRSRDHAPRRRPAQDIVGSPAFPLAPTSSAGLTRSATETGCQGPAQPEPAALLTAPVPPKRSPMPVAFVIQQAVAATADVYRDPLRTILERQDGSGWLEAFNQRRRADMLDKGLEPSLPYRFFEPRTVLSCLAYDSAGLQLISAHVAAKARRLAGLANAAFHSDPLSEADGHRAWRLYREITGRSSPADPFGREH
ncbi:MAG: hypothetical protein ACR2LK_10805 [Solirubrobacteraceae bacterium]